MTPEFQFESPEPKIIKSEDQIEGAQFKMKKMRFKIDFEFPKKYLATKLKKQG